MNKIVALIGFSCSGKDTIQTELENHGFKRCVSHTTRPKREGEVEGFSYYYIDNFEFDKLVERDFFVEQRHYNTVDKDGNGLLWQYGLSYEDCSLDKGNRVVVVDYGGFLELKEVFGDKIIGVFMDVDNDTRLERAKKRESNFNELEWERRLQDDIQQFDNIKESSQIDFFVENYNTEECIDEIIGYIEELT